MERRFLNVKMEAAKNRKVIDIEDDTTMDKKRKAMEKVEKRSKLQFHGTLMDLMNCKDMTTLETMLVDPNAKIDPSVLDNVHDTWKAKPSEWGTPLDVEPHGRVSHGLFSDSEQQLYCPKEKAGPSDLPKYNSGIETVNNKGSRRNIREKHHGKNMEEHPGINDACVFQKRIEFIQKRS